MSTQMILRWTKVGWSLGGLVLAVAVAWPGLSWSQAEFDRRLTNLESLRPDARLTTIETRLDTIESVGKGILIAVGAQLIVSVLSVKRSRG